MGAGARIERRNETPAERRHRIASKELSDARYNFARAERAYRAAEENYEKHLAALNARRAALEEAERELAAE